jgi:hypothetical protein
MVTTQMRGMLTLLGGWGMLIMGAYFAAEQLKNLLK